MTGQQRDGSADDLSRGSEVVWDVLSSPLWRVVPHRLAMAGAGGLGHLWWYIGRSRRRALADMSTLLGSTTHEFETKVLARASLVEHARRRALECRPWERERADVIGLEHLQDALSVGRGGLIVTAHLGCLFAVGPALSTRGHPSLTAAGPWVRPDRTVGRAGRRARQFAVHRARLGGEVITVGGAAERMSNHLRAGGLCTIAFDAPGHEPVLFMGRLVRLPARVARLARLADAPLVPAFAESGRGHRPRVRVHPAIWPERFADDLSLTGHLAGLVEREIMTRPHALERTFIQTLLHAAPRSAPDLPDLDDGTGRGDHALGVWAVEE